jgi:metal-responsive CopG/Arc/MetJ family transcriptional regulator
LGIVKTKTSITLSPDIVAAVDALAGRNGSRSAVIERILRQFIKRRQRQLRNSRDLETLDRHSKWLNAEAADTSEYQGRPTE